MAAIAGQSLVLCLLHHSRHPGRVIAAGERWRRRIIGRSDGAPPSQSRPFYRTNTPELDAAYRPALSAALALNCGRACGELVGCQAHVRTAR